MDPNCDMVATSSLLTADTQVKSSHSVSADPETPLDPSGPDEVSTDPLQESVPYSKHTVTPSVETGDMQARVSCEEASPEDGPDASLQSLGNFIKVPYVIHNLASHGPLYIPKGTVITYTDDEEPEMDCFEIAKSYEEAQEMMQYRNHLPKHPLLPVPPKSDFICSPTEVKLHHRVELKDHDASKDTKKHFEELCQAFPEVFSTSSEDIGRTNLITMDIDTSDSPPSAQKPYTLPLKHYDWVQQEIESLE